MTEIGTSDGVYWENRTIYEINTNIWYYLAVTYSYMDGYYSVYVNGVERAKISTNGRQINTHTTDLFIGSYNGTAEFWSGVIDEVRGYSYCLTENHIKTDMVSIINVAKEIYVSQSYEYITNTWTEGLIEGYTGFNNNDVDLPFAKSNATKTSIAIESIRYIAGFSKYRYYCTLKMDANPQEDHDIYWQFEFFRNGIRETAYNMKVRIDRPDNYTQAGFYFEHWYNGSWKEQLYESLTFDREIPPAEGVRIIVDAWIGSDSKHFVMRMALENNTDGDDYFLHYSFDLTDNDGVVRHISWFDGWVIFKLGIWNRIYHSWSLSSTVEISEHGLGIIAKVVFIVALVIAGTLAYQYLLRPASPFPLPPIPILPESPTDFAHQLIGAFASALQPVIEAFSPLTNAVLGIGGLMIQAFIDFAGQISIAIIDGFDILGLYVFGIDGMFSSFVAGASLWLGQIGILAGHMASYIVGFIGFIVNIGTGIGQTIAGFFSLIAYSMANSSADILGQITSLFSYLDQFWNATGVFEGAMPFSQFWLLFTIAFLCFIGLGIEAFGFGWLLNGIEKFNMILNFIKGIVMFGFNLLQKIMAFIRSLIPI